MVRAAALALSTLIALGTNARAAETDYSAPRPLTEADRARAEAMLARSAARLQLGLKEPESARFRNVRIRSWINPRGGILEVGICGEMNAKNSYGGYGGWEQFGYSEVGYPSIDTGRLACPPARGWYDGRDYTADLSKAFAPK